MDGPKDAAGPGGGSEAERVENQQATDAYSVSEWLPERERPHRLTLDDERRRASRALDELLGDREHGWHPSLAWDRRVAKQLLDAGWDKEYLTRRFNLHRKEVSA